jgi:hypothetical protein
MLVRRGASIAKHSEDSCTDAAEWTRCLSCLAYNLGAKLWREDSHGKALPFLQIGVDLALHSLQLRSDAVSQAAGTTGPETATASQWKALQEQIPKRWELVASCFQAIGQKKVRVCQHSRLPRS